MPTNIPTEGDVFTPKSDTLDVLLPNIDRHAIALPQFQRPWVWDPNMVRAVADIGSLSLSRGQPPDDANTQGSVRPATI